MAVLDRDDLVQQLRYRLGEDTAAAWTDAELVAWLNEGVRDVAIRTECCEYRAELFVDEGVYLINFPSWATSETLAIMDDSSHSVAAFSSHDPQVIRIARCVWVDDQSALTELSSEIVSVIGSEQMGNTYDVGRQVYPLEYMSLSSMDAYRGSGQQTDEGIPSAYALWGQSGSIKIVLAPRPSSIGHLRVYFYGIPPAMAAGASTSGLPIGWEHLLLDYGEYKAKLRDSNENWQAAKAEYEMHIEMFTAQFKRLTDHNEPLEMDAFWHDYDDYGGYW